MSDDLLRAQLPFTLKSTAFPSLGTRYEGKVRDTYRQGDRLVLVTTDRLSAFDHVLTTIPFKGDLLNRLAQFWFEKTQHVVKNHVIDVPDPCVTVARFALPLPVEFVVRGYLTGSLWRDYIAGRDPYTLKLAPGLRKDAALEKAVLTPTTKEALGRHDEPLSETEVLRRGLLSPRDLQRAKEAALALFAEGSKHAQKQGLILVDTKYEFGLIGDDLVVIDEMHTPDSSRFWVKREYEERLGRGEAQLMLDKEYVRRWLMEQRGFSGHGLPPPIPEEVRVSLAQKYLSAFEQITGTAFQLEVGDVTQRITHNLRSVGLIND